MLQDLKKRLENLENSPAPSKVVVTRGFGTNASEDADDVRLKKVNDRLSEIAKIKDENPTSYTEALANEAYDLVKAKKALVAKMI